LPSLYCCIEPYPVIAGDQRERGNPKNLVILNHVLNLFQYYFRIAKSLHNNKNPFYKNQKYLIKHTGERGGFAAYTCVAGRKALDGK